MYTILLYIVHKLLAPSEKFYVEKITTDESFRQRVGYRSLTVYTCGR